MTLHYIEPNQRYIDYLVKLAAKNVCDGVIEEPRAYFDIVTLLDPDQVTQGNPDAFVNAEQFPIRLTHVSAALIPDFSQTPTPGSFDERFIQRVGMRMTYHDQFYQSADFVAVPLWLNKITAAPDLVTQGGSTVVFDRPLILSARDSIRVEVQLRSLPASPRRVSAAFTGVGMLSRRPYFLGADVELSTVNPTVLATPRLRNDGTEPIALTDMALHCSAEQDDAVGQGDIRFLSAQVRQIGNGTNADWFKGPSLAGFARMPSVLNGYTTGRCVVHQFPGDGLIWEPGEGIDIDFQALAASAEGLQVGVSLWGYISVT